MFEIHAVAAAMYLVAFLSCTLGVLQLFPRGLPLSAWLLGAGSFFHTLALYSLHYRDPAPSLEEPVLVFSLVAWVVSVASCLFLARGRLAGLVVLVSPVAFSAVSLVIIRLPMLGSGEGEPHAGWSHLHVLISSAGIGLLGISGVAGALYLWRHRDLKKKNPYISSFAPSLEALEKLGLLALCIGFLCMTFGVLTGLFWAQAVSEKFWSYTEHGLATIFTWVIYVSLLVGRLGMGMSSLKLSIGSFVGFLFLLLTWLGSEAIR